MSDSTSFKRPSFKRALSNLSSTSLLSLSFQEACGIVKRAKANGDLTSLEVRDSPLSNQLEPENTTTFDYAYEKPIISPIPSKHTIYRKLANVLQNPWDKANQLRSPVRQKIHTHYKESSFHKPGEVSAEAKRTITHQRSFDMPPSPESMTCSKFSDHTFQDSSSSALFVDFSRKSLFIPVSKPPPTPKSSMDDWHEIKQYLEGLSEPKVKRSPSSLLQKIKPKLKSIFPKKKLSQKIELNQRIDCSNLPSRSCK